MYAIGWNKIKICYFEKEKNYNESSGKRGNQHEAPISKFFQLDAKQKILTMFKSKLINKFIINDSLQLTDSAKLICMVMIYPILCFKRDTNKKNICFNSEYLKIKG